MKLTIEEKKILKSLRAKDLDFMTTGQKWLLKILEDKDLIEVTGSEVLKDTKRIESSNLKPFLLV